MMYRSSLNYLTFHKQVHMRWTCQSVGVAPDNRIFNMHRRAVIERAFGLLGIRFPRITHLKFRSNKKRILCVVATCVLHNLCLLEDDEDESVFEH